MIAILGRFFFYYPAANDFESSPSAYEYILFTYDTAFFSHSAFPFLPTQLLFALELAFSLHFADHCYPPKDLAL